MKTITLLLFSLPFVSALLLGLSNRFKGNIQGWVTSAIYLVMSVLSVGLLQSVSSTGAYDISLLNWINIAGVTVPISFRIDSIAVAYLLLGNLLGFGICIYSGHSRKNNINNGRYYAYLCLFSAFFNLQVASANLILFLLCFEGIGLVSALFLGLNFSGKNDGRATSKMFFVHRASSFFFLVGFVVLGTVFSTFSFIDLSSVDISLDRGMVLLGCLFCLIGIFINCAQIPFSFWLSNTLNTSIPTSAYLFSGLIMSSGVLLLGRLSFLFAEIPAIMNGLVVIGLITALFGALAALVQDKFRDMLNYSTISQLGLVVLAVGAGATSTAQFHYLNHIIVKAFLIIVAGILVKYFPAGTRGIVLIKKAPLLFWSLVIASISLIGFPGLGLFFSWDEILWITLNNHFIGTFSYLIGLLVSILTVVYLAKFIFLLGYDKQEHKKIKLPLAMTVTLSFFLLLTLLVGYTGLPSLFADADSARLAQKFIEGSIFFKKNLIYSMQTENSLLFLRIFLIFLTGTGVFFLWSYHSAKNIPEKIKYVLYPGWTALSRDLYLESFIKNIFMNPIKLVVSFLNNFLELLIDKFMVSSFSLIVKEGSVFLNLKKAFTMNQVLTGIFLGVTVFILLIFNAI